METEYAVQPDVACLLPRTNGNVDPYMLRRFTQCAKSAIGVFGFGVAEDSGQLDLLPEGLSSVGSFISNGMRSYLDVGQHPESADQESFSALGLTLCHFAGIEYMKARNRLVAPVAAEMHNRMVRFSSETRAIWVSEGKELPFYLQRQVTDDGENTWGVHLNISAKRELAMDTWSLSPLLLAMLGGIPLFGAGYVDGAGRYRMYQKGNTIRTNIHKETLFEKPLINSRDEPHADPQEWRRLHIVANDPVSVYPTWLRAGIYELCVAVCEERPEVADRLASLLPISPRAVISALNEDTQGKAKFRLGDEKHWTAPALLQRIHIEAAQLVAKEDPAHELHKEHLLVLNEWQLMIDALRSDSSVLGELLDNRRRLQIYEAARERGKRPGQLQELYHLMNDIGERSPAGFKNKFQDYLANNGWDRLGQLYGYDPETLKTTAQDYIGCPSGRALERAKAISLGDLHYVDWHYWHGAPGNPANQEPLPADYGINGHYDPLARTRVR